VAGNCECGNAVSDFIKCGECLEAEIGWLLMKDSTPWSKLRGSHTGISVLLKLPKQRLTEDTAFRLSKPLYSQSVLLKSTSNFGSVFTYLSDRRVYGLVGWLVYWLVSWLVGWFFG